MAGKPRLVIAWHLALVDDCSFECVPGSHYQFRTPAQHAAMGAAERAPGGSPMPGAISINLKNYLPNIGSSLPAGLRCAATGETGSNCTRFTPPSPPSPTCPSAR